MTLAELSIKRHVLAWMLSGVVVLFGLIAYQRIGIDRIPAIDFPIIVVSTTLRGADPDVMDTSVTSLIESGVNTTPGIEHIQSTSSPGVSLVTITFALDKNIDVAYNEVQAKVNQILRKLPKDIDPPIIQKVDSNAQPVIWLALTGDRTIQQLNLYANNVLKKKFETIDGIGEVLLGGRRDRVIRVIVSPQRMAAYALSVGDLINAFSREHLQLSGGFMVSGNSEYLLKLDMEFHRVDELGELVISSKSTVPIRLKDIAKISDDLTDNRQIARYDGQPAVSLGMVKIANANTVRIIEAVKQRLEEIRPSLPAGMYLDISTNDAIFIQQLIASLKGHLVEGTLFAALIVLMFLRSFRSTIIIATTIPVSLLAAIAVMYFCNFTFNAMTMLGLLLLIGVVVDDAIVVLENIERHLTQLKEDALTAALKGSREVTFAVIAASLALVCIFAPVIFMDGILGKFFKSFAVVVTFGVLASLFISLTLTPMLCSRYLTPHQDKNMLFRKVANMLRCVDSFYECLLDASLKHRTIILVGTLLFVLVSGALAMAHVDKDFVPETDESSFSVNVKTPLGSSLRYTDERLQRLEQILQQQPEIESYSSGIGTGSRGQVNQGYINVRLKPKNQRHKSQQQLIRELKARFENIPGVLAIPAAPSAVRGQRAEKLQFNIAGTKLADLGEVAERLKHTLTALPQIGKVDLDLQLNLPQLKLDVDRIRANQLGISTADVANAVSVYAGGFDVAKYNDSVRDGQRYDIRLKASDDEISQATDLNSIYLRARSGKLVRLDTVAHLTPTVGAAVISRYDLQYSANFFANPNMPLGDAIAMVEKTATQVLPAGYTLSFSGQAEEFGKTFKNIKFILMLSFILLYMVLASQFNSFLQPFVIMLAQPLAIIGGLIALSLSGDTLNVYSMIGLVLLIGLVAKNSILLVDLANQLHAQGMNPQEAIRRACPVRLRPVLMTSCTIILALLPAALGLGAGSESNKPLSVAIIGGMLSSTLLTLVVVPAAYSWLMDLQKSHWAKNQTETFAKVGERDEVQGVRNTGGETYQ